MAKNSTELSNKNFYITLLLCIFIGTFGAHRFYSRKTGTGIIMLLTVGGLGVWWLIDLVMLCLGIFKDKEGKVIKLKKRYKTINSHEGKKLVIGSLQGYGGEYQLNLLSKEEAMSLMEDENADYANGLFHTLLDGGGSCMEQEFANYGPNLQDLESIFPLAAIKPIKENVVATSTKENILQHVYATYGKVFSEEDFVIHIGSDDLFDESKLLLIYEDMKFDPIHNIENQKLVVAIEYAGKECHISWTDSGHERFITLAGLDSAGQKVLIFDSRKDQAINWDLMQGCIN